MKKNLFIVMLIALMLGLQGCPPDPEQVIETNDMRFEAENISIEANENVIAISPKTNFSEIFYTVVTINGNTSLNIKVLGNRLPVLPGNEIEVRFQPSHSDETEAQFTFPDGTIQKATLEAPNVKWIVPDNVTTGMEIKGESWYKEGKIKYIEKGTVSLEKIEL